jgi:hypothetical protein
MVAEVVCYAWRHQRLQHRLGAPVNADRARSRRDASLGPQPRQQFGAGAKGQVTLRGRHLRFGISAGYPVVTMTAISQFLFHFD